MTKDMLIFEIGTEEIPAFALVAATKQLEKLATEAFEEARVNVGRIKTCSTPRRLVLEVRDIAPESTPLVTRSKGPAVAIAYDEDGNPTKAAIGFARGKGLGVEDLVRGTEGGKEYVYAIVEQHAKKTVNILPGLLEGLIVGLSWPRSMKWGTRSEHFSRPVRWLFSMWNDTVIPVSFAGVESTDCTWGHRLLANEAFQVPSAKHYYETLARAWVIPEAEIRGDIIHKQIKEIEEESGLVAEVPDKTFTEVVNLVEYPTVLLGRFEEKYLEVPSEIITDALLEEQRYFPMKDADGKLSNAFLVVSNGARSRAKTIIDGNERVVRPRLADAEFFYHEDLKRPLEDYVAGLSNVVFQEKLGTVADKTTRIEKVAATLCAKIDVPEQDVADAIRAAHLCKADLITHVVVEFTSVQGVIGGYYARKSGETEGVAQAITDHYRPRFAGDDLPRNFAGRVVAFCDKLDTIVGIFAADQAPTGSSDPFAVRRSAIGCIQILLKETGISLPEAIQNAVASYEGTLEFDPAKTIADVSDFFAARLDVMAKERGFDADTIAAVSAVGCIEPVEFFARVEVLEAARKNAPEVFDDLATAFTRAANLTDRSLGTDVDERLFADADRLLAVAVVDAEDDVTAALEQGDYKGAVDACADLRAPIDQFFEDVLVMDPDESVRDNRLRLLNRFVNVFERVADIGKLSRK